MLAPGFAELAEGLARQPSPVKLRCSRQHPDARCGGACNVRRAMLVAVTDHAAERFRQRVRGTLDAKTEVASRVAAARASGRVEPGQRGAILVRDLDRRDLVYVCRIDGREVVVVTVWEEGESPAVPRRFTDALRRDDHKFR